MKLNKFFMLGLAGLAFAACNNDNDGVSPTDDGNNKTMIVSIAGIGSSTRATTTSNVWSADTDAASNISSLTLFFTDAAGAIKYAYQANSTDTDSKLSALLGDGVKFIGLEGVTAVHAVANKSTITIEKGSGTDDKATVKDGNTVITNISGLSTAFDDQDLDITKSGVIYVGSDKDITPANAGSGPEGVSDEVHFTANANINASGEEGNHYYTANIVLKPIISRIQIKSIKVATSGSNEVTGPNGESDYTLSWSNFKPKLLGIYLNNFYNKFKDLEGTVSDKKNNENYTSSITAGKWNFDNDNFATNAAYVKYESDNYTELLSYGTTENGITPLTIGDNECIAFNVFVPFTVDAETPEEWTTGNNPTIHFQFDKEVNDGENKEYEIKITDSNGDSVDDDYAGLAKIKYTLPVVDSYLFANIKYLYSEDANGNVSTNLLQMKAGKIYNMEVTIYPVNMTIDLKTTDTYNVVVKITVLPFTQENIYPGFE